ncbi:MAG: hypothetical protein H7A32_03490 [Deltaproteobacteria bacterium]|nr:hypothetical protein [Deltaproteobacteria bacterium]
MSDTSQYISEVGEILAGLKKIGIQPILVGGMALVTLGSRRVTRDFDFVISNPEENCEKMLELFYKKGLQLASRLNENKEITVTIDNPKIASIRLRLDAPQSAYFLNPKTGLRIDLLFDFPLAASELISRAKKTKIQSCIFYIASAQDLLRLKKIAKKHRKLSTDSEDIAFLEKLQN